jgi:hypothetical protein
MRISRAPRQVERRAARAHPAPEVVQAILDLAQHRHGVGDHRLVGRAVAVVGLDRRGHRRQTGLEGLAKTDQVGAALGVVGDARGLGGAQARQGRRELVDRRGEDVHAASVAAGPWSSRSIASPFGRPRYHPALPMPIPSTPTCRTAPCPVCSC